MSTMLRASSVLTLAALVGGCGGVEVPHRPLDLSVGASDEVALVDGFSLGADRADPELGPAVTFVDPAAERVERVRLDPGEGDTLRRVARSSDRAWLAVVSEGGRVHLLDEERQVVRTLQVAEPGVEVTPLGPGATSIKHRVRVGDVAWVPGRHVLAVSYEAHPTCGDEHDEACGVRVRLVGIDGERSAELKAADSARAVLPRGPDGPGRIDCTPDGALVLVMSDDAVLRAYSVEPFELAWTIDCSGWGMPHLGSLVAAVTPDGRAVVVGGETHLVCYDLQTRAPRWMRDTGASTIDLVFAEVSGVLVALQERLDGSVVRGAVRFLDPTDGDLLERREDLAGDPCAMAPLAPDEAGDRVVVAHARELEVVSVPRPQ